MGFKKEKKFRHILHVYIPEDSQSLVEEAKMICEREGESLSKKIVDFCADYAALHRHGNPQMLMDKFIQEKLDTTICQMDSCDNKAEYLCFSAFPYGKDVKLCNQHRIDEERKGNVRGSKKLNSTSH